MKTETRELFKAALRRVRELRLTSVDEFERVEPRWFLSPDGRMTARAAVEAYMKETA